MAHRIEAPFFPIVYVRGFAMTDGEREATFHDAFYGFAKTAVNPRKTRPQDSYLKVDVFEGQLLRFMKEHRYTDASNAGLQLTREENPSRSIWVCRFYDDDVLNNSVRDIDRHAEDLKHMITEVIPARLEANGVDLGRRRADYRVILIAHSMGGLVCRTFIQNLVRGRAARWVEKFVTIGTPHGGIELDAVPDPVLRLVQRTINPANARIFDPKYMRKYLRLRPNQDVRSLDRTYDPKRCLCVIGSNYSAYNPVQYATGSYSDGLVKQDNAYMVGAHRAHVHHPHSGQTGIVNSYETYENLQRFLFGDLRVTLTLRDIRIETVKKPDTDYFYDIECLVAIRNTGVFVHRREADPCENSIRRNREEFENPLILHTGFLNTGLKPIDAEFSHFALTLRVKESAVEKGWLWDREYPDVAIFQQTVEFRVGDLDPNHPGVEVEYRWRERAKDDGWTRLPRGRGGRYTLDLAEATPSPAFKAKLAITGEPWNI